MDESKLSDFSRILAKMPQRNNLDVISQVMSALFEVATALIKDEHSKQVLTSLSKFVCAA